MRARGVGAFVTALCLLTASTSVLAAAHPAPSGGEESAAAEAHDVPEAEEAAPAEEPKAARLSVSGLGWLENLQMKGLLRQLRPEGEEEPATYDANAIEDGAFLLLNRAQSMGYLQAEVSMEVTTEDGGVVSRVWREGEMESLPRPLTATEVRYVVAPGKRYFHERLVFRGLTAIDQETARGFFVRANGLLQTRALLRFSEREFEQAAAALETELQSRGYADAKVTAGDVDIDHETGAVRAEVVVEEGRMHRLGILRVVARESADGAVIEESTRDLEGALSRLRLEDIEQEILEPWFHEGYPDAEVELTTAERGINPQGERVVDVSATVIRGPRVKLGTPRFTGDGARFVGEGMRQRLGITGPWLDRIEVDEARARLARLGGFRFVNVEYEPSSDEEGARDPVFELQPGKRLTLDLLAGFRSYELLYGGVDIVRRNLFGVGHSVRLRAIQSFKSTEAFANYSIPDAFAEDLTIFAQVDLLRRQEVSFDREEYRGSLGVRREFGDSGHQVGLRYNYELLRAVDAPVDVPGSVVDEDQPLVSSFVADWFLERRDSAVAPRRGYHAGLSLEVASPGLGGEANFLRPEFQTSGHLPLGNGRFLRAGLRYWAAFDPSDDGLLPFNKRLFPGGEDTVRGYQRGEASPLNSDGEVIGAESALIWNVEFEQLLTPTWSIVTFVDGVAGAADISDAPWDEVLWSVGGGIRWNTAIGPVRLEYGHNLTPRDEDPSGTLHFSIGFPF